MRYQLSTIRNGLVVQSEILLIYNMQCVVLTYKVDNIELSAEDNYPFFALVKIRLELEKLNLVLMCNGSRIDVYPSGMSVSGVIAYELKNNKQATKQVNIFDSFKNKNLLGTVQQQKMFRENWLKSLRR